MIPGIALAPDRPLVGLKGRAAPRLLEALGQPIPATPNAWTSLVAPHDGWCLRQGAGEFLLASSSPALAADCRSAAAGDDGAAFVLLRQDRCIVLDGPLATARLLQVCDIDERLFERRADLLALVHAAGVSVCLQRAALAADGPVYRLWCDPTYAPHLLDTLTRLAAHES